MRSKLKAVLAAGATLMALSAASSLAAAATSSPDACAVAVLQSMSPAGVVIEKAEAVGATKQAPAHCAVTGYIDHGGKIGISLLLPTAWNNKFLFMGIGGFAGAFLPLEEPPYNTGLLRGYATGTTDTGHKGAGTVDIAGTDATWALNNPAGVINHFESGVELSAQVMKTLVAAYYGYAPKYAYFQGCSGGGRQAMAEAERSPGTFDGVISEAPAWNYSHLFATFLLDGQQILRSPANWISPSQFEAIDRKVMAQCDAVDGVKDGIIMDPRACHLQLSEFRCKPGDDPASCLTAPQLATLKVIVDPPFAKGRPGYYGFYLTGADHKDWGVQESIFGTAKPELDASGRLAFAPFVTSDTVSGASPLAYVLGQQYYRYIVMNDPSKDPRDFDLERDYPLIQQRVAFMSDADQTDLGRFFRMGHKLLIWHGWSDPAIPPGMSIDLYERIKRDTKDRPGQVPVDESVRLFMAPGVNHCGWGSGLTQFDVLSAMEAWVEHGSVPERIPAAQLENGVPVRTRPLCRYPQVAHYSGHGDPNDERNFDCR